MKLKFPLPDALNWAVTFYFMFYFCVRLGCKYTVCNFKCWIALFELTSNFLTSTLSCKDLWQLYIFGGQKSLFLHTCFCLSSFTYFAYYATIENSGWVGEKIIQRYSKFHPVASNNTTNS